MEFSGKIQNYGICEISRPVQIHMRKGIPSFGLSNARSRRIAKSGRLSDIGYRNSLVGACYSGSESSGPHISNVGRGMYLWSWFSFSHVNDATIARMEVITECPSAFGRMDRRTSGYDRFGFLRRSGSAIGISLRSKRQTGWKASKSFQYRSLGFVGELICMARPIDYVQIVNEDIPSNPPQQDAKREPKPVHRPELPDASKGGIRKGIPPTEKRS